MCEFVSWKEVKCPDGSTQILFLTSDDVFNTSKGRKLQNHTTPGDFIGHGAIDFYYDLDGKGVNHECTDFWTPKNFPPEIVEAIKAGKFFLLAPVPAGIFRAALYADYLKKRDALDADYLKKRAALYADCEKKRDALYADYGKKRDALYADCEKKQDALDADYVKKRAPLYADTWLLVSVPENRSLAWQ